MNEADRESGAYEYLDAQERARWSEQERLRDEEMEIAYSEYLRTADGNYDGQGKSRAQETEDSMRMLGGALLLLLTLVVLASVTVALWWRF